MNTATNERQAEVIDDARSSRSWLPVTLFVIAALVSVAGASIILGRDGAPGDTSPEAGFARDMSVHHAQAVEMALIAEDRTRNPEIHAIATDIILTQQAQIGQMRGWLDIWRLLPTGTEPPMVWMGHAMDGRMPGMASPEEIATLRELPPDEVDEQFLRLMIPHHEAGVEMAEAIIERTDREPVERFAEAIATAQQAEIEQMQELLDRLEE